MKKLALISIVAAIVATAITPAHARTWVDRTGQRTIEAEFVSVVGNDVKLRKADGAFITLGLDKFCEGDRQLVRRLAAQQGPVPAAHKVKASVRALWSPITMTRNGVEMPKPLEVYVDLAGAEAEAATHYGPVNVTRAECAGKDLVRMKDPFGRAAPQTGKPIEVKRDAFNVHIPGGLSVKLMFQNPGNVIKVSAIEGTAMIRTGGNRSDILIKGIAEAKRFPLSTELSSIGVSVKLERYRGVLRLDLVKGADKVTNMKLVDAADKEYEGVQASRGTMNDLPNFSFHYDGKLFRDAVLKISVITGTRDLAIPFSGRDLQIK